jgi:hypothetical protein
MGMKNCVIILTLFAATILFAASPSVQQLTTPPGIDGLIATVSGIETVTNANPVFYVCPWTNLTDKVTNSTLWYGPWRGSNYVQLAVNALRYYQQTNRFQVGGGRIEVLGINYSPDPIIFTNTGAGIESFELYAPSFTYGALVCLTNPCIQMISSGDSFYSQNLTIRNLIISSLQNQTNFLIFMDGGDRFQFEDDWFGYWGFMTNNQVNGTVIGLVTPTTGEAVDKANLVIHITESADKSIFSRNHMLGLAAVEFDIDHLDCEYNQASFCGNNLGGNGYTTVSTDWDSTSLYSIGAVFIVTPNANQGYYNFRGNFFYRCLAGYYSPGGSLSHFISYDDEFESTGFECLLGSAGQFYLVNPQIHQAFPDTAIAGTISGPPYTVSAPFTASYVDLTQSPIVWSVGSSFPLISVVGTDSAAFFQGDGSMVTNIPATSVTGQYPPINAPTNVAGTNFNNTIVATNFIGKGKGLTNLTGLLFTNSPASFLKSGGPVTVNAAGFLSVSVLVTNTQITWLTNTVSHVCLQLQNPTGTSQTVDKAAIFCNSNDTVIVTNMSGSGGTTIVGCWYQVLH